MSRLFHPVFALLGIAFPRRAFALLAAVALGWAPASRGATASFVNLSEVVNPQIDATAVVNFGRILATNDVLSLTAFPFQTLNTLYYTNTISAVFLATNGSPGFQFELITNTSRFFASHIVNQGIIEGDNILLSATNLINSGSLLAGTQIQLRGNNVDLSRSVLSASGVSSSTFASSGFRSVSTNGVVTYQNPSTVADLYWGAGTGNVMTAFSGVGFPLDLFQLSATNGGFYPPNAASPPHEVQSVANGFGTLSALGSVSGTNFYAYARTNRVGTNVTVQVVLVQTNSASTNLTLDVRFASFGGANFFAGNTPVLRFGTVGTDITTGAPYTNNLYFFDYLNTRSNSVLSDNLQTSSSRPAAYEVSRSPFNDFYFSSVGSGSTSNTHVTNIVYGGPDYVLATVTNNPYAAYQLAVGSAASVPGSANYVPHLDDPTNSPGRIDISANSLDLSFARIRADGVVSLRATNLISTDRMQIEAPFIQLDVANTNTTLTLTNFAAPQLARPNGVISFYSTTWTNSFTNGGTVNYRYHVLMVDASRLTGITPVTLQEFTVRGTNVIINNDLNIGRAITISSPAVTFSASSTLNLPPFATTNLLSTNFPGVNHFTNLGIISVPYQCALGSDRATALTTFVNRGTLTANSIAIRAVDFESTGTNLTRSVLSVVNSGGGPISIIADSAKFEGGVGGGLLSAGASLLLAGNDLKIRNHRFSTAGTLVLSPTNSLTDTGASGTNRIDVALGFTLTTKPASGDLLGTTIRTSARFNLNVPHVWAGTDFGPVPAGYTNNVAVGRLLLDTSTTNSFNRLSFAGIGASNALYVDYLELSGTITNDLATHLFMDTNMVLYFANANVPVETLDGQLGGRLRWVKDYAGLNTGVDVRLADGRTVKVNVAKLNSLVLDSDADGIVNGSDLSPFDGIIINSQVTFTNVPPLTAFVTWEAAAQTLYQVEVNTNLLSAAWQFHARFTNTAATNRVITFPDVIPAGTPERYYRVLYQP
ncbi:MAG: hypothetical protein RL514_683 [Verrucomicrobiota bacterium]|jgi:hypothetical protein